MNKNDVKTYMIEQMLEDISDDVLKLFHFLLQLSTWKLLAGENCHFHASHGFEA